MNHRPDSRLFAAHFSRLPLPLPTADAAVAVGEDVVPKAEGGAGGIDIVNSGPGQLFISSLNFTCLWFTVQTSNFS